MKKLMFGILVAFGLVSVSFAYELSEVKKGEVEGVKEIVAELERVKKQTYNNYIGEAGEYALSSGKNFLEFIEKVKQSKATDCKYAVREVMSDGDNKDKYRHYIWSESEGNMGCMPLHPFVEEVREAKKWLDNKGIKHNLP